MKITTQTNEKECGVCVITSFHNHYYNKKITKDFVLEKSNLQPDGMSIFDFENLAGIMGLDCESYEVKWAEFVNIKISNFFVALVTTKQNEPNHYIIVKKKNSHFLIYDSCLISITKMDYLEFQKIFLGVIIFLNKKQNKFSQKQISNFKSLFLLDGKYLVLYAILSFLLFLVSIVCASFLNWIIDLAILPHSIINLFVVCFLFLLFYFLNNLITFILDLYTMKRIKNYYSFFISSVLKNIEYKKTNFLFKFDKFWFFRLDEIILSIANFCAVGVNKLFANLLFCVISMLIIGIAIQPYLLFFIIFYSIIEFCFFFSVYLKKKPMFINTLKIKNKSDEYYSILIKNLNQTIWQSKQSFFIEKLKKNYDNIYKNFYDFTFFKSRNNFFKKFLNDFGEILLFFTIAYLVIKIEKISIGKLTFILAIINLYKNSCQEIFQYFLSKIDVDVYWQIYKELLTISNQNKKKYFLPKKIKEINFCVNNQKFCLNSSLKENKLTIPIHNLINNSTEFKIGNQVFKDCNVVKNDIFIIVDSSSHFDITFFQDIISKNPEYFQRYNQYFKFNFDKKLSTYNEFIVNLLSLFSEKNKIIFIDYSLFFDKYKDKKILKQIFNEIKKNNTLFFIKEVEDD